MKASELRIGNIVSLKDKGEYRIASGHDIEELEDWDDTDYCVGVRLTEQWLKYFGFRNDGSEWSHDGCCFEYWKEGLFYSAGEGIKLSSPILYVHQLQNIYFAITGRELVI